MSLLLARTGPLFDARHHAAIGGAPADSAHWGGRDGLRRRRDVELLEGHWLPDHIHMRQSIPPKYSIAHAVGFLKGKSAVRIHRELMGQRRMTGLSFWATGCCVSTVGLDEDRVRRYIREQEELEQHQGELDLK